jgi:hypothetical protein
VAAAHQLGEPRGRLTGRGTEVTINGSGFGPAGTADEVLFCPSDGNCADATDVEVRSDSVITAVTPAEKIDTLRAAQPPPCAMCTSKSPFR